MIALGIIILTGYVALLMSAWVRRLASRGTFPEPRSRPSVFGILLWRSTWRTASITALFFCFLAAGAESDYKAASTLVLGAMVYLLLWMVILLQSWLSSGLVSNRPIELKLEENDASIGADNDSNVVSIMKSESGTTSGGNAQSEDIHPLMKHLSDGWMIERETELGWQLKKRPPFSLGTKILFWLGVLTLVFNGLGLVFFAFSAVNHYLLTHSKFTFIRKGAVEVSAKLQDV